MISFLFFQQPVTQGPTLAEGISRFTNKAETLIALVANEAGTIQDWAQNISWLIVPLIILYAGVREYYENSAQGRHLFWWFGRLAVCLFLLGSGQNIITELYVAGKELAVGNMNAGYNSPLYDLFQRQELNFHVKYQEMIGTQFQVNVGNEVEYGVFDDTSGEKILFPLYTGNGNEARDIMAKTANPAWQIKAAFNLMNFARAVLEFGNVWIVVLTGLLVLVYKATCPLFLALAIDRKISQRTVTGWAWGLIVLTLVWPSVSYFLRAIAYLAGDLGLSVFGSDPVYSWNEETLTVIQDPNAEPLYFICFGAAAMLMAGLALWLSPLIAFKLSFGAVFETVVQTTSQLAASLTGLAISGYNAVIGAAVGRQADQLTLEGRYAARQIEADAGLRSANLHTEANRTSRLAEIRAGQTIGLAYNRAGLMAQTRQIEAANILQKQNIEAGTKLSTGLVGVEAQASMNEANIGTQQRLKELTASRDGQYWQLAGHNLPAAIRSDNDVVNGVVRAGAIGMQAGGIWVGYDGHKKAAVEALQGYTDQNGNRMVGRAENIQQATTGRIQVYDENRTAQQYNQQIYADTSSVIARDQAQIVAGGINTSASIQRTGVDQSVKMQLEANKIQYEGQMKAAGIEKDASSKAAELVYQQKIRSALYESAARLIEKNLENRF